MDSNEELSYFSRRLYELSAELKVTADHVSGKVDDDFEDRVAEKVIEILKRRGIVPDDGDGVQS